MTQDQLMEFRLERDAGQKINATIGFLRQNFRPLFKCILWYVVPFAILAAIFSGIYQGTQLKALSGNEHYGSMGAFAFAQNLLSFQYWVSLFFTLVGFVLLCLTVYSYMLQYRLNHGRVDTAQVWETIKSNFISCLYSSVGVGLMIALASLLLLLPGIYVAVACSMFIIIMLHEEVGFLDAVERCFYLIKGHWWSSFGFLLLMSLIQGIIGFAASLPAIVIYVLRILHLPGGENDVLLVVASAFTTFIGLLLYVLTITSIAFLYFDLVEKKEGVGLLEQVDQIGAQPRATAGMDLY